MKKKLTPRQTLAVLIASVIFTFVELYFSMPSTPKNYVKVSGEVVDTYEKYYYKMSRRRRTRIYIKYIKVSYEYAGETYYAEDIRANFWEKEGSHVHFYIDPDFTGPARRGKITFNLREVVLLATLLFFILYVAIKERDSIFSSPPAPISPTEGHYLFYKPETQEERAFYHSALNSVEKDLPVPDFTPQNLNPPDEQNTSSMNEDLFYKGNSPELPPETVPNVSSNETSLPPEEKDEASNGMAVIQIPDKYLH